MILQVGAYTSNFDEKETKISATAAGAKVVIKTIATFNPGTPVAKKNYPQVIINSYPQGKE